MLRQARGRVALAARRGVTLLEIVVALAIMVVIAGAIFLAVGSSSRTGGDAARIDEAATTLARLADALARYSNASVNPEEQSFTQVISGIASGILTGGVNAGRLSYLTTKITNTDLDSCGAAYSNGEANRWIGPFYPTPIPATGLRIADGFFANDLLVRYDQAGVPSTAGGPTTPATLAIVMPGVAIEDARALAQAVEGDQGGVVGAVRFTASGNAPVTVSYHVNIHGC